MSAHRDAWMDTDKADKASPAGQSSDGIGSLKSSPRMDPVPAGSEGARPYRSRKERPCDLCRRRKGRCIIEEVGQRCQACNAAGKDCTFQMDPTPRSRPDRDGRSQSNEGRLHIDAGSYAFDWAGRARSISGPSEVEHRIGQGTFDSPLGSHASRVPGPCGVRPPHYTHHVEMPPPQPYLPHHPSLVLPSRVKSPPVRRYQPYPRQLTPPPSAAPPPRRFWDYRSSLPYPATSQRMNPPRLSIGSQGEAPDVDMEPVYRPEVPQRFHPAPTAHGRSPRHTAESASVGEMQSSKLSPSQTSNPGQPTSYSDAFRPTNLSDQQRGIVGRTWASQRTSAPRRSTASTEQHQQSAGIDHLHSLVAAMVEGEELARDDTSGSGESDLAAGRGAQERREDLAPFLLGSSSSEDPVLLRQASSPSASPQNELVPLRDAASRQQHGSQMSRQTSQQRHKAPSRVRLVTKDPKRPVYFSFMASQPYDKMMSKSESQKIVEAKLLELRRSIGAKVAPLMVWYAQRDSAAFPLLTTTQRRTFRRAALQAVSTVRNKGASAAMGINVPLPTVLATAALATSLVYDKTLRATSKDAWGANLNALIEQFNSTTLVTLQVACADLAGRPSINTSGNMMSLMQAVGTAHMLGLHLDPTSWALSREERDVRIRIWWAIVIHDKWSSLCWGRPSVIHKQDFSVPLPKRSGLSVCNEHLTDKEIGQFDFGSHTIEGLKITPTNDGIEEGAEVHTPGDTFAALAALTQLLDSILVEFHAVQCRRNDGFAVAQRVRSFMVELDDWCAQLPDTLRAVFKNDASASRGADNVAGTKSLQLSYFGVLLLLCRTALDAVSASDTFDETRILPALRTALHATQMVVDWLDALDDHEFSDGFFLPYCQHHLSACLSLLARLAISFNRMQEEAPLQAALDSLRRFLTLLAAARRRHSWDLSDLALGRASHLLTILEKKIPNFPALRSLIAPTENKTTTTTIDTPVPAQSSPAVPTQSLVPTENLQNFGGHTLLEDSIAWFDAHAHELGISLPHVKVESGDSLGGGTGASSSTMSSSSTSELPSEAIVGSSLQTPQASSMGDNGQLAAQTHLAPSNVLNLLSSASNFNSGVPSYGVGHVVDGIDPHGGSHQDPFADLGSTDGPALINPDPWLTSVGADILFNT
ncbi:hypothetical protein CBOM_03012 [Ceraceosorus bombacis]|uniref:Zn(2)-C6 fungal-type domain-containing protein n=1 Tax=Ceraceosorus bombacis TaxID=401625 RepID=A0A0P1BL42_9BASI|nr:hypothetical protein CBOM_03012 [Ceraceosorus bombacis]